MGELIEPTDQELIAQFQQGSQTAYKAIYDRYVDAIYRYLAHLLGQREAAQDVTQEVFIRLYHQAHLYKPTGQFSSWLYRMAKNLGLNYLRDTKAVRLTLSIDAEAEGDSPEVGASIGALLADDAAQPDEVAASKEQLSLVRKGLRKLSADDREVIILCVVNKLERAEVAKLLGCSVDSLKVRLHRARQRLAESIGVDGKLFESE